MRCKVMSCKLITKPVQLKAIHEQVCGGFMLDCKDVLGGHLSVHVSLAANCFAKKAS